MILQVFKPKNKKTRNKGTCSNNVSEMKHKLNESLDKHHDQDQNLINCKVSEDNVKIMDSN